MANDNKKGGGNNIIADAFGFILAVGIFIAIFSANGQHDLSLANIGQWSRKKSADMQNCYTDQDCLKLDGNKKQTKEIEKPKLDEKNKFPEKPAKSKSPHKVLNSVNQEELSSYQEASKKLDGLIIEKPQKVDYDRSDWKHWISTTSSCRNTREEVLYRDAKKGSLSLLDKSKKKTNDKSKACYVIEGQWTDPYSRDIITDPKKIDIDHVIPLKYVAQHGGQDWDKNKKQTYANDYEVLLAVSATENRRKSDKGPENYMPPNIEFHCDYSKKFIDIAYKYNISISEGDKKVLKKGLNTCNTQP